MLNTDITPKEFRRLNRDNVYSWVGVKEKDMKYLKGAIEQNIYFIPSNRFVPLHEHKSYDEIFTV